MNSCFCNFISLKNSNIFPGITTKAFVSFNLLSPQKRFLVNSRVLSFVCPNPSKSNKIPDVRVRFAPSPTGKLHLGGLRTALYNYLFARKNDGKFILRIEDTDKKRFDPDSFHNILDTLQWVGLVPDEGPKIGGSYGPYVQKGSAYKCYCSPQTLDEMRDKALKEGKIPTYDKRCSKLSHDQISQYNSDGIPYTIRLKCPSDTNIVNDKVYGTIKMGLAQQDDAVLMKSDGTPTYHMAHPIDDHLMNISHVFRGEEWLSSTPKHLAIYRALDWTPPIYVHLPLLFNSNRTKLSKRSGDVDVDSYRNKGYLPEAILNFIAFLGWSPKNVPKEILNLDEMVEIFSLDDLNKSNPVVNIEKLNWINNQYILSKLKNKDSVLQISRELQPEIKSTLNLSEYPNIDLVSKVLLLVKDQLNVYSDICNAGDFFFKKPDYNKNYESAKFNVDSETISNTKSSIQSVQSRIGYVIIFIPCIKFKSTPFNLELVIQGLKNEIVTQLKKGSDPVISCDLDWGALIKDACSKSEFKSILFNKTFRFAITGKKSGPSMKEILPNFEMDEIKCRLDDFSRFLKKE
ncbi:Glutamate-tRNA ligase [Smittium mucronatum]|uniref:Glutamate--tRNA ligase, mitochondrial n=1 Tax=Smittium mucronatum TaxID=133383 RepID=A0A1R0GTH1_9FUNG|nr:Glutamate-tRNA ligase [Smittium mucronatum]